MGSAKLGPGILIVLSVCALSLGVMVVGIYIASDQADVGRLRIGTAFLGLSVIGFALSDFFGRSARGGETRY